MSIVQGPDTYAFAYNGLGDRLRQTVDPAQNGGANGGVATNYTLDLESGLTQVLSDGEETFLYGPSTGSGQASRLAQQGPAGRQYFLADALGSARQLVDDRGQASLGRAYEPFGDLLSIAGRLQTSYGFAGEWADATGLIHLRARYYQPTSGRFVQSDPFPGVPTRPMSLNAYPYAYDNPLTYTDASGRNPILALAAGIAGGIAAGALAGTAFGALTYNWALAGECGCEMRQWASTMTRSEWIGANALSGGLLGGAALALAAVAAIGPGALILVSGLGLLVSVNDFVNTVEIILYETGLTACTGLRLLFDVLVMALSTVGIINAVRAFLESGSVLSLEEPASSSGRGSIADYSTRAGREALASRVASETGGTEALARGDGWRVTIPRAAQGGRNIVVRIMNSGGVRDQPYFRVSVDGKGALTLNGSWSDNPLFTHHTLTPDSLGIIKNLVEIARLK
ncbi:MAG TPA: RHS repeat-associated core domain-containing protein [Anaerolineales bacterium]|nr:RHS repeat-associated core domain-containing protein [Anaerolineales bacterium]